MNEPVDIEFRINNGELELQSRRAVNAILGVGSAGGQAVSAVSGLQSSIKKLLVGFAGTAALKSFVSEIVNVRGEIQALEASFEVLLGNKQRADSMLAAIKSYAVESPLSLSDVSNAAQTLLGFNIEAEKVIPIIKQIGDISMGNGQKFQSLILAFSQMSATGRLMGQDLLQMINAGFNPLTVIAEQTGKSLATLKKEMEGGAISAEMVADAFRSVASEGGKFYGMTQKQAEGIKGLQAQLGGAMQDALNSVGKASEGVISSAYKGATALVQNYEKIGKILVSLIATYGTYRAALVLTTVAQGGLLTLQFQLGVVMARLNTIAKTLNTTLMNNPYTALATIIVGVVTAMWALSDSTTAAEKALKEYNEEKEAALRAEDEHRAKIEALIATVSDQARADFERVRALDALKKEYPDIFKQYDIETLKLADVLKLKKQIAEMDGRSNAQDRKSEAENIRQEIKKYEEMVSFWNTPEGKASDTGGHSARDAQSQLDKLREKLALVNKDILEQSNAMWEANTPLEVRGRILNDEISAIKKQNVELEKQIQKQQELNNSGNPASFSPTVIDESRLSANHKKLSELEAQYEQIIKTVGGTAVAQNKAYWENVKKNAESARDQLVPGTENWDELTKKITEAEVQLKKYNSTAPNPKKDHSAEREFSAEQKRLQEVRELQKRIREQEMADEMELSRTKIDLMEEGTDKELAQIEHSYDKRMLEIAKKSDELIRQQQDIERKMWENENPDWKEKKLAFSPSRTATDYLTPEQQKQIVSDVSLAGEARKKAEADLLKALLDQYRDFNERRFALEKQFNEDVAFLNSKRDSSNENDIERTIAERKKAYDSGLKEIDRDEAERAKTDSALLVKVFSDASRMSRQRVKEVMTDTQKLIDYLKGVSDVLPEGVTEEQAEALKSNVKNLIELYDKLADTQKKFESKQKSPFSGIENGINKLKESKKYAQEATKATGELAEKYREMSETAGEQGLNYLVEGASSALSAIDKLSQHLKNLAEITGNEKLSEFADKIEVASRAMSSAVEGFKSGGLVGGIVGGAISLFTSAIESIESASAKSAKIEQERISFLNDYQLMLLKIKDADYESIFGVNTLRKSIDATEKAINALERYNRAVNQTGKGGGRSTGVGSATGGQYSYSGSLSDYLNEAETMRRAIENGMTSLQGSMIKVIDRGWLEELLGKKDKYKTLFEYAPELWSGDINGDFDVDAAKAFLNAHTEISEKLREEIESVIELKEAYEEAIEIVKDDLRDTFGYLGDDITGTITNAISAGSDAWDDFKNVGIKAVEALGQKLLYELFFSRDLSKLQDRFVKLYETETSPEAVAQKEIEIMNDYFNGLEGTVKAAQTWAEEWQRQMEEKGYDIWKNEGDKISQQTKTGDFRTVSQESFDLWLGQFAAIRIHTGDISSLLAEMDFQSTALVNHLAAIEKNTFDAVAELKTSNKYFKTVLTEGVKVL